MHQVSSEFLSRIKDSVSRTSALGRLSDWLCKNTTLFGKPYSFKDHEAHVDIIDLKHPNAVIIKPSQVGMSEASARLVLGFLAVQSSTVSIYTLPTVHEAQRFAKSRIDPVIEGSKYLRENMAAGNDSSSFKQILSSQLFMVGTWGKALISIPTDLLVVDELDFSSAEAVITAESRLSHSRFLDEELNIRGIRRKLSTPTVSGLGVSAAYSQSDKRKRMVKCKHCHKHFWPNFLFDVVVQGFDRPMDELQYTDVIDLEERGLLSTAKLLCPSCHGVITQQNLGPEYREWVAEFPSVKYLVGFQLSPFDFPKYHSPESILRKRIEYGSEESHFRNFTLGLPHDNSSNSVEVTAVARNTTIAPVYPESSSARGCVLGLDIGRTSYLTIMRRVAKKEYHVIWVEQIRVGTKEEEDNLLKVVLERMKQFGVVKAVIDAQPFFDTVLRIQAQFPDFIVLPNMYLLRDTKLPAYVIDEPQMQVKSNRTKVIDLLVKKINTDQFKFAKMQEMSVVSQHLQGMKRIEQTDEKGVINANWVKSGSDHYFHSLAYANIAAELVEVGGYINFAPAPSIKEVFIGRNYRGS